MQNKKARLFSAYVKKEDNSQTSCSLRLYYHMYGQNIGALNIYSKSAVNGREDLLFKNTIEVGDYWERLEVSLNDTQPFRIIIEGVVGDGDLGLIGIDDTSFTSGCIFDPNVSFSTITLPTTTTTINVCGDNFKCKSNDKIQCIPYDKVCNFINECDDSSDEENCGTCDFEQSSCGWYDQSKDKFFWNRRQAPSLNFNGPQIDHTNGANQNGHFLTTEINPQGSTFVNQAILLSPKLQKTSENCKVTMWLHMGSVLIAEMDFLFTNASNYNDYAYLDTIFGPLGRFLNLLFFKIF